jgi:uncharacterized protein (UPF0335 family)
MTDNLTSTSKEKLKAIVSRVETLNTEKDEVSEQIKEVYGEAKSLGFDVKTIRKVIAERKKPEHERQEADMILDLYLEAVGEP